MPGVSFRFHDTSFCFVNSHLPARAERIVNRQELYDFLSDHERNEDFSALCEQLNLGQKKVDLVNQFDHLIWLGDLNYRIDLDVCKENDCSYSVRDTR